MKYLIRIAVCATALVPSLHALAQSTFLKCFDLGPNAVVSGSAVTPDSGLVICGHVDDSSAFLMKLDAAGDPEWTRKYGAMGVYSTGDFGAAYSNNWFRDVMVRPDSSYVVVGTTGHHTTPLSSSYLVAALDQGGDTSWARSGVDVWGQSFRVVLPQSDGMVIAAGVTGSSGGGWATAYRVDLDAGTFSAVQRWSGGNGMGGHFSGGEVMANDEVVLIGSNGMELLMVRTDSALNEIWHSHLLIDGYLVTTPSVVSEAPDGTLWIASTTTSSSTPWLLIHCTAGGIPISAAVVDVPQMDNIVAGISIDDNGEVLVVGYATEDASLPDSAFAWLMRFDAVGALLWSRRVGQPGVWTSVNSIEVTDDNIYLIGHMSDAIMVARLDTLGQTDACDYPSLAPVISPASLDSSPVWIHGDMLHEWYRLAPEPSNITAPELDPCLPIGMEEVGAPAVQVEPNPFRVSARIVFAEVIGSRDRIDLLDVNGRVLRSWPGNGTREVLVERGALPSGLYMIRALRDGSPMTATRVVIE